MIRIRNLHKTYQVDGRAVTALRDINLEIGRGEIFGIIGRSGAGKSSLIRTLNLLERPSSGHIEIDGQDITALDAQGLVNLRQQTGMVFQHFNLLMARTVEENIVFPLKLAKKPIDPQHIQQLLELVGLQDHRHKYPAQLSGGQKQRVGIARALANAPKLLLCDEATSALDPQTTQAILQLLLDINRRMGLTIVLITHEMNVVKSICDRVAVIDAGEIVELGPVSEIFLHPAHPATQSMLAESGGQNEAEWQAALAMAQGTVLRLSFTGATTHQPLLHELAQQWGIAFNILHGTIGRIKDTPYGQLIVEVAQANTVDITALQDAFAARGVRTDILQQGKRP